MSEAMTAAATEALRPELLPDRSCGDCTLCCTALRIDEPEIQKIAGVTCKHCTASGCGIYETRFPVCRRFHCAYRLLDFIDAELRPDRTGVLPYLALDPPPPGYGNKPLVRFLMLRSSHLGHPAMVRAVCESIAAGFPTQMSVNGGRPGRNGIAQLLNDDVRTLDRADWAAKITSELKDGFDLLGALAEINGAPARPFVHSGARVG